MPRPGCGLDAWPHIWIEDALRHYRTPTHTSASASRACCGRPMFGFWDSCRGPVGTGTRWWLEVMTEIPCGAALFLEEMSRTRFNQGLWREAGASAALCLPLSAGEDKRAIIVNSCNAKQFIRVTVNYRVSCIPFSLLFNSSNDQYNPSGVTIIHFFMVLWLLWTVWVGIQLLSFTYFLLMPVPRAWLAVLFRV